MKCEISKLKEFFDNGGTFDELRCFNLFFAPVKRLLATGEATPNQVVRMCEFFECGWTDLVIDPGWSEYVTMNRKIRGVTQEELSRKTGVAEATIVKVEHGPGPYKRETLAKLANSLGLTIEEYTGGLWHEPTPF